jgi:hypothetical protein
LKVCPLKLVFWANAITYVDFTCDHKFSTTIFHWTYGQSYIIKTTTTTSSYLCHLFSIS